MTEIILMSDARVAAVPVEECGEPLVDVRESLLFDDRKHVDSHGAEVHLRRTETATGPCSPAPWPRSTVRKNSTWPGSCPTMELVAVAGRRSESEKPRDDHFGS
ncbi:hypothetical protein AQJ84_21775 [Streptomyces resistomycificus]|nr:hypothetical protein AQJ84_21775 [Streptomyces resistomycificus]